MSAKGAGVSHRGQGSRAYVKGTNKLGTCPQRGGGCSVTQWARLESLNQGDKQNTFKKKYHLVFCISLLRPLPSPPLQTFLYKTERMDTHTHIPAYYYHIKLQFVVWASLAVLGGCRARPLPVPLPAPAATSTTTPLSPRRPASVPR